MTRLGTMLQFQKPPGSAERAIAWFLRAAALGDSYGMVRLGFTYRDGHGVAIDSAEALRWFIKAVEAGDGHSMIFVGRIYRSALVSPTEAVKWFLRAAKAGFSESHIELAMLYDDQKSPVRDPAEAVKWYHVVADGPGGNKPRAMLALARHYRDGIGTLRSPEIAKTWLSDSCGRHLRNLRSARKPQLYSSKYRAIYSDSSLSSSLRNSRTWARTPTPQRLTTNSRQQPELQIH